MTRGTGTCFFTVEDHTPVCNVRQTRKRHLFLLPQLFIAISRIKLVNTVTARVLKHGGGSWLKPINRRIMQQTDILT